MTSFSYTTGNPSNLVGGTTASMNDIQGPFTDLRTFLNGANLDSTNLAAGPTLVATQQAWQNLAVTASNFGVTWTGNWQYMKDSLGFIHVRGRVSVSALALGAGLSTLFTLPVGFRPGQTFLSAFWSYDGTAIHSETVLQWATDGTVAMQRTTLSGLTVDIGNVVFSTA